MKQALAEVNSGQPLSTTAGICGISARTLKRHRDGKAENSELFYDCQNCNSDKDCKQHDRNEY